MTASENAENQSDVLKFSVPDEVATESPEESQASDLIAEAATLFALSPFLVYVNADDDAESIFPMIPEATATYEEPFFFLSPLYRYHRVADEDENSVDEPDAMLNAVVFGTI